MSHSTSREGVTQDGARGETTLLAQEALTMLKRTYDRLCEAAECEDDETVRWLHKQIVSVERRAQERGT